MAKGERKTGQRIVIAIAVTAYLLFVAGNFLFSFLLFERYVNIAVGPLDSYSNTVGRELDSWLTENDVESKLIVQGNTRSVLEELNSDEDEIRDFDSINVGFVAQNVDADDYPNIVSLGTIATETLVIFARTELGEDLVLDDFDGAAFSIGEPGSDVNELMVDIIDTYKYASRLDIRSDPTSVGVEQLLSGEVDALAVLDSIRSPIIEELAVNPELQIVTFDRASALAFELGYAEPATIPPSFINFAQRIPAEPITTLSVELTVVADEYLDEPNILLIAKRLSGLDTRMNLPTDVETYPNFLGSQFPASQVAQDYYNGGTPLRYTLFPDSLISWVWVPLARVATVTVLLWAVLNFLLPFVRNLTTPFFFTKRNLGKLERRLVDGQPLTERQKRKLEELVAMINAQSEDADEKLKARVLVLLGRSEEAVVKG